MRNLYFMSIVFDKLYLYYELIVFVIHTNTMVFTLSVKYILCVNKKKVRDLYFM